MGNGQIEATWTQILVRIKTRFIQNEIWNNFYLMKKSICFCKKGEMRIFSKSMSFRPESRPHKESCHGPEIEILFTKLDTLTNFY